MDKRAIRVYATRHFDEGTMVGYDWKLQRKDPETENWLDDWEEAAGSLTQAVKDMQWVFIWGIFGKLSGQDWLVCGVCGEVTMSAKANGTPSARKPCRMTPKCTGRYRRMPEVFVVVKKDPPKRKTTSKKGVGRGRKGYPQAIKDEALALIDAGMKLADVARKIVLLHPEECAKMRPTTISNWMLHRDQTGCTMDE